MGSSAAGNRPGKASPSLFPAIIEAIGLTAHEAFDALPDFAQETIRLWDAEVERSVFGATLNDVRASVSEAVQELWRGLEEDETAIGLDQRVADTVRLAFLESESEQLADFAMSAGGRRLQLSPSVSRELERSQRRACLSLALFCTAFDTACRLWHSRAMTEHADPESTKQGDTAVGQTLTLDDPRLVECFKQASGSQVYSIAEALPSTSREALINALREAEEQDYRRLIFGDAGGEPSVSLANDWLAQHANEKFKSEDPRFVARAIGHVRGLLGGELFFLGDSKRVRCTLSTERHGSGFRFRVREADDGRAFIVKQVALPRLEIAKG